MIMIAIAFRENHFFSRNKFPFQEAYSRRLLQERVFEEHAAAEPDAAV